MTEVRGTETASDACAALLMRAAVEPAGLVLQGEAGIGKSTAWTNALQSAAEARFRVLSARASASEARLTFTVLADLLDGVEEPVLQQLPEVQRVALNRVLLRGSEGPATDERVAAAAFRSVLGLLAQRSPVLVAIDDLPWMDRSSQAVVGYAARRLGGPIGLLATARTGDPDSSDISWLQLPRLETLERLTLGPLSLGALHRAIAARLRFTLPRPLLTRIHQVSGGNPFYALELARTVGSKPISNQLPMPTSLATMLDQRLATLAPQASELLLAAACGTDLTVAQLTQATSVTPQRVIELIEGAESSGIVSVEGPYVRFTHPLLAHGVYARASGPRRRAMHRTLAAMTELPELRARHLAMGAVSGDESTLQALDAAADAAAARGAPTSAAELTDLAINLGGDNPFRRLRAAEQHFRAGALDEAENRLHTIITAQPPGTLRSIALMLRGAVYGYGNRFDQAAEALTQGISEADDNPALRLQGLLLLALAVGIRGDMDASVDYARRAVADAAQVGNAELRCQALALWVHVSFMHGLGTDQEALQTALDLEDPNTTAPATLQAAAVAAVNCAWTGNLHEARVKLDEVWRRCLDRGNEVDVVWAAQFTSMCDLWLGRYSEAARIADDAVRRAEQIGSQLNLIDALTCQAAVAAYRGREEEARHAAHTAIDAARDNNLGFLAIAPTASLTFLEVSLRNYHAALTTVQPLLSAFDPEHSTEIMIGGFLPDAIETLTWLGHLDEAESLIGALQTNGARMDRPWMLAVGARGRAMLLAARGDLDAAVTAADSAMEHHDRLPMPFERARTQLVVGQLQRRRRERQAAAQTFAEALASFEAIGAPLWAERARSELARTDAAPTSGTPLTPTELRIAQRAAAGLSNRNIAAEQFISEKTVEMNLSRVDRKLGIRSRAGLFAALQSDMSREIPNVIADVHR